MGSIPSFSCSLVEVHRWMSRSGRRVDILAEKYSMSRGDPPSPCTRKSTWTAGPLSVSLSLFLSGGVIVGWGRVSIHSIGMCVHVSVGIILVCCECVGMDMDRVSGLGEGRGW